MMKKIFKKKERHGYIIEVVGEMGYIVYKEITKSFATKEARYSDYNEHGCIEFVSTKSNEEIYVQLNSVFGTLCNIEYEYGVFTINKKALS